LIDKGLVKPLERIVDFVNETDHFAEVYFPDPSSDKYEFLLPQIVEGLKSTLRDDKKITEIVFSILDGLLQLFRNKINAEKEVEKAYVFNSKWGKCAIMETNNEEALKLALKMGYSLAVRKSSDKGFVRIKTLPSSKLNLTPLYLKFKEVDPKASWFLHISKNMLLNGSSHNPKLIPSRISLKKLIEIIKEF
jgi:hypothetical protein